MGQRSLTRIYDVTSAAGGAVDSGSIDTGIYSALIVAVIAAGAAAPASASVSAVIDGMYASLGAVTLPAIGAGAVTVFSEPPQKTRFQATGGAASTVRVVVFGVRD